jgi:hypothetical protein
MRNIKLEYRLELADLIEVDRDRTSPEILVYLIVNQYLLRSRDRL